MKPSPAFALLLLLGAAMPSRSVVMAAEPEKPAAVFASDGHLTPAEEAEKAGRRACKVDICKALRAKDTSSGDIACHVIKSWRKEQMVKFVGKLKVKWPYEGVHCATDLSVKRGDLVRAMTEPKVEIEFEKHAVTCTIANGKDGPTEFKFELTPTVKFENGKATAAHANWGKIEAPALIKSALWTATAADNTVNLLSGTIVDSVNDFVTTRCDEVKDQWAAKQ